MSDLGKRLIKSAEEALAFAEGKAEPKKYRVHPDQRQYRIYGDN